jgi:hypothetical protein
MSRQEQWIKLDKFRRREFLKAELKKKILKSIIKNIKTTNIIKYLAFYNYTLSNRASSVTQVRNRCVWYGRNKMVVKKARYSLSNA